MEKKRSNKKLFAIIGGSVLAFILTIALSVSITLAYFGDYKSGSATVTMGQAVTLNSSSTATTNAVVIPTQRIDFTTTITGDASTTDSVLFAAVAVNTTGSGAADISSVSDIFSAGTGLTTGWVKVGTTKITAKNGADTTAETDAVVYAYATDGKLTQLGTGAVNQTFGMWGVVPSDLTNDVANQPLYITVEVVRVQIVYDTTDGTTLKTAPSDYFDAVKAVSSFTTTITAAGA